MATKEQLISEIQGLEQFLREANAELEEQDTEILRLKDELSSDRDRFAAASQRLHAELATLRSGSEPINFKDFDEWMHRELPAGTIIGDPGWWAVKIHNKWMPPPLPKVEPVDKLDAERLDWIEEKFFASSWNGVVGSGNATSWRIAGDYRHTVALLTKDDFREAIDAARSKK